MDFAVQVCSHYKKPAKDAAIVAGAFLLGRAYSALNLSAPFSYLGNVAPLVVTALKVKEYRDSTECYSFGKPNVTLAGRALSFPLLCLPLFEARFISSFGLLSLFRVWSVAFYCFSQYLPKIPSLPEETAQVARRDTLISLTDLSLSQLEFTTLEQRNVNFNELRSLPEDISGVTNLTRLNASLNKLTSLPSLSKLTRLEKLEVDFNELRSFPEDISELANLTRLHASCNKLTSLPSLSKLTRLEGLNVSNNELRSLPEDISELANLTRLDVRSNELTSLPSLSKLTRLEKLSIPECCEVPKGISRLTMLRELDLCLHPHKRRLLFPSNRLVLEELSSSDKRKQSLFIKLLALTKLENLSVEYHRVTDMRGIAMKLTALKLLNLEFNQIQDLPVEVSRLTDLTHLDLIHNKIKCFPACLTPGRLPRLKTLRIHGNPFNATPRPVERFAPDGDGEDQGVPSLKEVAARRVAFLQSRPAHSA